MATKRGNEKNAPLQRSTLGEHDYTFEILLVGDSGVGKSGLLDCFTENKFSATSVATTGIDLKVKTIEVDGKTVKLKIWDTCGQEMFRAIIPSYYRRSHGIMIVYDISDQNSFAHLEMWLTDINKYAPENVCKILVGNKCDLPNLVVSIEAANLFAVEQKIPFLETSVKKGVNVNKAFNMLAEQVMNNHVPMSLQKTQSTVEIKSTATQTKKGGTCCLRRIIPKTDRCIRYNKAAVTGYIV